MYHYHMKPFRRKIYKKKCEMAHFSFSPILYLESFKKTITAVILGKIHAWWDSFLYVC